jgi:hypothetical protein
MGTQRETVLPLFLILFIYAPFFPVRAFLAASPSLLSSRSLLRSLEFFC